MLRVVADENFKEQIVNGLRRRLRELDITTTRVEVPDLMPIGTAIEQLVLVVALLDPEEIQDRVLRLPL